MGNRRDISALSLFASFFALGVIGLGAFTRLMDAGLGCPDWPGCYGQLIPSFNALANYKAWTEMIHRYFAGTLSFLIVCLVMLLLKNVRTRINVFFAVGLIVLVLYQILLGQWTVTLKLMPLIVTEHLLGGFLILSLLWLIYLNNRSFKLEYNHHASILFYWTIPALVLLFFQITMGAWTSTHYASLSCPDFPFCHHENMTTIVDMKETYKQTIQMTHRFGALLFTVYIVSFFGIFYRRCLSSPSLLNSMYLIFGLLGLQLCIGIANIFLQLPLALAVSHTIVAALLLLSLMTWLFKLKKMKSVNR